MCVRARERELGKAAGCTVLAPHLQLDIEAAGEERTFYSADQSVGHWNCLDLACGALG